MKENTIKILILIHFIIIMYWIKTAIEVTSSLLVDEMNLNQTIELICLTIIVYGYYFIGFKYLGYWS